MGVSVGARRDVTVAPAKNDASCHYPATEPSCRPPLLPMANSIEEGPMNTICPLSVQLLGFVIAVVLIAG